MSYALSEFPPSIWEQKEHVRYQKEHVRYQKEHVRYQKEHVRYQKEHVRYQTTGQGHTSSCILHGVYCFKDRDSRP